MATLGVRPVPKTQFFVTACYITVLHAKFQDDPNLVKTAEAKGK